ncbi:hypothetical protein [Pseudomonas syringae]|uniref:hypothetical protein n=1 Tax=Pseudomonas syringae TaxID=317 RepID=UPI0003525170|nr:hypothetical protein [Pseudomonas syringae]EPF66274.1 Prophage PssSM-02, Orf27 [Pseudomonas syringae pv. syringae SM]
MSKTTRKVQLKERPNGLLAANYVDEVCDRALVIGIKEKEDDPQRISILFSRDTVEPNIVGETEHPFILRKRFVATITMDEADAKRLALHILKGLGVKSLEVEPDEVEADED